MQKISFQCWTGNYYEHKSEETSTDFAQVMMSMKSRAELEAAARRIRLDIVRMTYQSGLKGAHLGGSMSVADILAVLYGEVLHFDAENPLSPERDRLILSKAHAAVALYAALHEAGFLSQDDIDHAMQGDSPFFEHPKMDPAHGIEFSGGSLGQGLSLGMGTALGMKKKGNTDAKVYVILGDGECDEGQIWEAAQAVAHFNLTNVTVIVDDNGLQFDGRKEDILTAGNPEAKWESLGYDICTIDGHDVEAIRTALLRESNKPRVILAKTIKGKGVHFAENAVTWHTGRLTNELYQEAIRDLND